MPKCKCLIIYDTLLELWSDSEAPLIVNDLVLFSAFLSSDLLLLLLLPLDSGSAALECSFVKISVVTLFRQSLYHILFSFFIAL